MSWLATAALAGVTSFVATNIDDIIILMLLFSQVNRVFRRRHIVAGQYLGFLALIMASLPGFFGGLVVPKAWISLLGLVPIGVGISQLISQRTEENEVQTVATSQSQWNRPKTTGSLTSTLSSLLSPQTYNVAAITIANGGDNVSIYTSLFASSDLPSLGIILGIFFLLIGVWCYVAYRSTHYPIIAELLTRHGRRTVPFVLIGLGIFILIESGSMSS
ncbi:cadmium resistance transporter [Leptolyngbya sp. FACHB-261]|uniref:cadmium resistance transporter n=1 Tax=Leptolyngbya sp. FACHB-261 TaxID=2692806 RepID=UPI00168771D7|nr:cadmium resistance transporter [Leptolyngbya sp. FACHB-261]MBD2104574.1 cadmium resistance transporter [Leptolyngbya sp. FACHB-261]